MSTAKNKFYDMKKKFEKALFLTRYILLKLNCIDKSKCSREPDMFGILMFNRMYVISETIEKLITYRDKNNKEWWDYASLFSLTRSMIECAEVLFYISFDTDKRSMKILRQIYMEIYEVNFWIRHYKKLGNNSEVSEYETDKEHLIKQLCRNTAYLRLSEKEKKKFRKAKDRFYGYPEGSIGQKMKYIYTSEKRLYFIFSEAVHTSRISLKPLEYRINKKEVSEDEISFSATALLICCKYLENSAGRLIDMVITKIKYIYEQYTDEEKEELMRIRSLFEIKKEST